MAITRKSKRRARSSRSNNTVFWVGLGFGVLLVGAILVALYIDQQGDDGFTSPDTIRNLSNSSANTTAELAPDFQLAGLEDSVNLADYRGQVVLLNFWASWCPPCRAEMPDLASYQADYGDQGFVIVAVNVQETPETADAFIQQNGFDFDVALDTTGAVFRRYVSDGSLPSSFIIGRDGSLIKAYPPGMISRAHLERDVTPLLEG